MFENKHIFLLVINPIPHYKLVLPIQMIQLDLQVQRLRVLELFNRQKMRH